MNNTIVKKIIFLLLFSFAALIIFNIHFFFIRPGVGPDYYLEKYVTGLKDHITEYDRYIDLSVEYSYLNEKIGNEVIVFLGDSITKRFNLHEFFPALPVVNRGIPSDTTFGILNRLENNVNKLKIKKLFLLIGYNDLQFRNNFQILENISKIASSVKAEKIYLQSLLPVDSSEKEQNRRIESLNTGMRKLCKNGQFTYIDLHSRFADKNGGIHSKFTIDGIHPNYFGYRQWATIIEEYLRDG